MRRLQLVENLLDRDYRESYAEGFLNSWISHQFTTVRRQRGLTQQQVAQRVGTKQSGVARMERDDYGRWNLPTLQKVAFALDCRLRVSLETFGSMVKEALDFTPANLERPAFADDPVFHFASRQSEPSSASAPLLEMRRKLLPWLLERGPLEQLAEWLQGYDLPPVGDEVTPPEWLLDALTPGQEELRVVLAEQVSTAIIERRWDVEPPGRRKEDLVRNLLVLAEGLRRPDLLGDAIWYVCERRLYVALPGSERPAPGHPLARAILSNQPDSRFSDFWVSEFLKERQRTDMPDYVSYGMLGMSFMGSAPNVVGIVDGAGSANKWSFPVPDIVDVLSSGFGRVWSEFQTNRELATNVLKIAASGESCWSQPILAAWRQSTADSLPPQDAETLALVRNVVALTQGCVN